MSTMETLASRTQFYRKDDARHIRRQYIENEMTGYKGFIFNPQEVEDEKITLLLGQYSSPPKAQYVEAKLGKLSRDLRDYILKFITNRGDFKTCVYRLVYILKVDAN